MRLTVEPGLRSRRLCCSAGRFAKPFWLKLNSRQLDDQRCQQRPGEPLPASASVVEALKQAQVHREVFLGDPAVRAQPGAQSRPDAFNGVDLDIMKTITILVAGVFAVAVADAVVLLKAV